ncbi:MAG TPA: exosortase/archaeosortase family protein, partial [Opitutaceae bacterium]|nr:exosortase/archaeosortase family protein [Opitutaceae bacterium]
FLEPFPGWPLGGWAYAAGLAVLAMALVARSAGRGAARGLLGPIAFLMAALPWPAFVATGLMGRLREGMAAGLAELFTMLGQPAVANGTVLQIGRGAVGIDEACGGIRSLQAAVLLALAIGELQEATGRRRIRLLAAGMTLAFIANTLRLAALTEICAWAGTNGVERWHDGMGLLEFAVVLLGLGVLAWRGVSAAAAPARTEVPVAAPKLPRGLVLAACALVLLPLSEVTVRIWFHRGGASARASGWSAELPDELPSFVADSWTPSMQALLGCDGHQLGHWRDAEGRFRAGYMIDWSRGRDAPYTLSLHNPDVCLPLSGLKRIGLRPGLAIEVDGERLPFAAEEFLAPNGKLTVYTLAWNVTAGIPLGGVNAEGSPTALNWPARWREVAAGRRAVAVRELVLAIFGAPDAVAADRSFRREIAGIVRAPAGP